MHISKNKEIFKILYDNKVRDIDKILRVEQEGLIIHTVSSNFTYSYDEENNNIIIIYGTGKYRTKEELGYLSAHRIFITNRYRKL